MRPLATQTTRFRTPGRCTVLVLLSPAAASPVLSGPSSTREIGAIVAKQTRGKERTIGERVF